MRFRDGKPSGRTYVLDQCPRCGDWLFWVALYYSFDRWMTCGPFGSCGRCNAEVAP